MDRSAYFRAARYGLHSVAASMLAIGSAAHAQEAAPSSDGNRFDDNEIVVTARKSNERIQDVPVSVTAVTADALQDRGAADIKDILRSVPGLANFGTERGLSRYSVRGLSTYASSPTVGIYLDDISLVTVATTFSGAYDPIFFDMERVEVLKGPQGTLYGGNAMGGAIKYVSAAPDPRRFSVDTAASIAVTSGGAPTYSGEVVVNAPIVEDKLAVRAGFFYRHDGGFVDNRPGDVVVLTRSGTPFPDYTPLVQDALSSRVKKNRNYGDTYVGRLSLEWRPDDSWSIRPQLFYQDYKQGDTGDTFLGRPDGSASYRIAQPNYDRAGIYSLSVEKEMGAIKATSLTAYFDRTFRYVRDYSFYIGGLIPELYPLTSPNISDSSTKTFSQEIRLASNNEGASRFNWVIGGYYSSQDDRLVQTVNTPGMAAFFGSDLAYYGNIFTNTKQYAGFGEASYTLFDGFDVTAGLRVFKVEQLVNTLADGLFNGGLTQISDRRSKEDGINPKFGLSYKIARDNLLYASAAKGFRPGGVNRDSIDPNLCRTDLDNLGIDNAPGDFGSDNLWTYEVGTKNSFGGGKLMLNASAYYTDWKKIQQAIGLPSCGFGFTANIGSAEVKGFEIEARVEPLRGFQLGGTAAFTKSKVTEAVPGTSANEGDALPDVPKWMATAYAGYTTELPGRWELDVRGEYQYQGKAPYSFDPDLPITFPGGEVEYIPNPILSRRSYQVVNAFASLSRDNTTIRLYANNLFNVRPQLDVDLSTGSDRFSTIRPRTVGIELRQGF